MCLGMTPVGSGRGWIHTRDESDGVCLSYATPSAWHSQHFLNLTRPVPLALSLDPLLALPSGGTCPSDGFMYIIYYHIQRTTIIKYYSAHLSIVNMIFILL